MDLASRRVPLPVFEDIADQVLSLIEGRQVRPSRHAPPSISNRPSPVRQVGAPRLTHERRLRTYSRKVREQSEHDGHTVKALVVDAVSSAAERMAAESNTRLPALVEADLKQHFKRALRDGADRLRADVEISTVEYALKFAEWPGVGGVDVWLTLAGPTSRSVFFELKWGAGTLYNCIWDAPRWPSRSRSTPATTPPRCGRPGDRVDRR